MAEEKHANDCLFCKIVNRELDVPFIYEDEHVVAFDDISPQAPVHTLIVPRQHVENLNDVAADAPFLGPIFAAAREVAQRKGIAKQGYRVIQNNGADAGQTVFHLHVHVLGGRTLGEGLTAA